MIKSNNFRAKMQHLLANSSIFKALGFSIFARDFEKFETFFAYCVHDYCKQSLGASATRLKVCVLCRLTQVLARLEQCVDKSIFKAR